MAKSSKKDLLVSFVIDQSGSMGGQEKATVEGFNSFIGNEVRAGIGKTYVTETLFSTGISPRYVGVDARNLPHLGSVENPYRPDGGTALYDAVGVTIQGTERWLENNSWFKGKVLIVIWTDGGENSSLEWRDINELNRLIERKQDKGWTFQFMGTGEAGWRQAQAFGAIRNRVHVNHTYAGNLATYDILAANTTMLRGGGAWNYTQDAVNASEALIESRS